MANSFVADSTECGVADLKAMSLLPLSKITMSADRVETISRSFYNDLRCSLTLVENFYKSNLCDFPTACTNVIA